MTLPSPEGPRLAPHTTAILLERLADASGRCRTFAEAMQAVLPVLCAHAEWHGAHAYLVQGGFDTRCLTSAGDWYLSPEGAFARASLPARPELRFGEGLPGRVWEIEKPLGVTDVRSMDPRFSGRSKPAVKSWFGVPIRCEGRVRGILEFAAADSREMHPLIAQAANAIASIVAAAFYREQCEALSRRLIEREGAQRQSELLSKALEQADDMVAMFDRDGQGAWRFSYVNEAFVRATGYGREEVLDHDAFFLEGPQTDRDEIRELRARVNRGLPYRTQLAYYRRDGSEFWVDVNARPILGPRREALHAIVLYHDITEARMHAQRLSYEAAHDALTGLYNRRYFEQALENALRGTPDEPRRHAVLFMDLDGFKEVNDTYGHANGDKVLASLAELLHQNMREGDVFARVGGDEFAVLLHDCSPNSAFRVAQHLLNVVRSFRYDCEGKRCKLGVSIGIACGKSGSLAPEDATREADEACYAAKRSGGNRTAMANSAQRAEYHSNCH